MPKPKRKRLERFAFYAHDGTRIGVAAMLTDERAMPGAWAAWKGRRFSYGAAYGGHFRELYHPTCKHFVAPKPGDLVVADGAMEVGAVAPGMPRSIAPGYAIVAAG